MKLFRAVIVKETYCTITSVSVACVSIHDWNFERLAEDWHVSVDISFLNARLDDVSL